MSKVWTSDNWNRTPQYIWMEKYQEWADVTQKTPNTKRLVSFPEINVTLGSLIALTDSEYTNKSCSGGSCWKRLCWAFLPHWPPWASNREVSGQEENKDCFPHFGEKRQEQQRTDVGRLPKQKKRIRCRSMFWKLYILFYIQQRWCNAGVIPRPYTCGRPDPTNHVTH